MNWEEDVPRVYRGARIDQLDAAVATPLREWLAALRDDDGLDADWGLVLGPNVALVGPVSTGKTYAAWALAYALNQVGLPSGHSSSPLQPRRVAFWRVSDLLTSLRDSKHSREIHYLVTEHAGVLFLDDVGTTELTEWAVDQLFRIVDGRRSNEVPTVTTTNYGYAALQHKLGAQITSRLFDGAVIVRVSGENRRNTPGAHA